jgi:hypothetical protein
MNIAIIENGADPFNGDWELDERGNLLLVTGQEEIAQVSAQRLRTFFGEWFLDTSIGIPYFDQIFEKGQNVNDIDAIFISEILQTPGIIRLLEFDLDIPDLAARRLELNYKAQTTESLEPLVVETLVP